MGWNKRKQFKPKTCREMRMTKSASECKSLSLSSKAERTVESKGIRCAASTAIQKIRNRTTLSVKIPFWCNYYKLFRSSRTFVFQRQKYKYFIHKYNETWHNERTVEIPIVWHIVENEKGRILEVGNVLSHYFAIKLDIVDKNEKAEGVINKDVAEVQFAERYDLIVSISTLEHVGWDENSTEEQRRPDREKILLAIDNLKRLLNPKGKIVITAPLGYNSYLDDLLKSGKLKFTHAYFLKRISKDNRWIETDWENVKDSKFNNPYPFANAIIIGIIKL